MEVTIGNRRLSAITKAKVRMYFVTADTLACKHVEQCQEENDVMYLAWLWTRTVGSANCVLYPCL